MKRSNGSGSVYKLSGNRRKPWRAVVVIGDDDGKLIRRTVGYYETKTAAELAIAMDRALPSSSDQYITLSELFEKWKLTRAFTEISKQTQDNYTAAYKYLKEFHKMKFTDIRSTHWQRAVDNAHQLGRSRSTTSKIRVLAGILSEYALAEDIVHKTYYQTVRLPKDAPKKEIETFNDIEIAKLFKDSDDPIVASILILIYTGMRITELLTLEIAGVSMENALIIGGVKTDAGRDRIIPIHPKIFPLVQRFHDIAKTYLIEYTKPVGNKKKGTDREMRSPYRYEYYCDLYYAALDRLGIRRLTPHKARHTFFTRLSERCKDRKGVAIVGGHTDPNFTAKTYDHPDIERLRKVIEHL